MGHDSVRPFEKRFRNQANPSIPAAGNGGKGTPGAVPEVAMGAFFLFVNPWFKRFAKACNGVGTDGFTTIDVILTQVRHAKYHSFVAAQVKVDCR